MKDELEKQVEDWLSKYKIDGNPRKEMRLDCEERFGLINVPDSELADIFNVSPRTIRRDKKALKRRLARDLENETSVVGELVAQYRSIIVRMHTAIENENHKKVSDLKKQWQVARSFADFSLPIKIEKIVNKLERVDSDKFEADLN